MNLLSKGRLAKVIPFVVLAVLVGSLVGCEGSSPESAPEFDFCSGSFSDGKPFALLLLEPGETTIENVVIHWDRWNIDSNPPSLVKEDTISALDGRLLRRDGATWVPLSDSSSIDELVALTLRWDLAQPLTTEEKLVYEIRVGYPSSSGNMSFKTSERHTISSNGDDIDSFSDICAELIVSG
jgi:hypothetical protein